MSTPLAIEAVHHIARVTSHFDAAHAFYCDVLNFKPIERPNFSFPGAWLYNYGVQIHLIATGTDEAKKYDPGTRVDHVAFFVKDVDRSMQILEEHGIEYRTSVVPQTGVVQVFFQDPDGNFIELGTYPEINPL